MFLTESFRSSVQNIFAHKMRSMLTILAIIIGIFAVVVMFSSVYGIKQLVSDNMEKLGFNNSIIIYPSQGHQTNVASTGGSRRFMYMQRQVKPLSLSDYQVLKKHVEHKHLYGTIERWFRYSSKKGQDWLRLIATTDDYFNSKTYPIGKGRMFNNYEIANALPVCVVGYHFANDYFPDSDPLGEIITVAGHRFKIIGVLQNDVLASGAGMNFNQWERRRDLQSVYIPLSTGAKYLKIDNSIDMLFIQSEHFSGFNDMKNRTRQVLLANHKMGHNFSFEDIGSMILNVTKELDEFMHKWNMTLTIIASISLIVGGLGLFSTMLISISERMMEIGIRKSVGATQGNIFLHFIMESMLLSLFGALIGIALSTLLLVAISMALQFQFPVVTEGILLGIGFAVIIGFFSGFYPAWKASEINPIQAIYYND
jgi:putative ABC transport system permease protein